MANPFDSLMNPAQVGQNALNGFAAGRKIGAQIAEKDALATLATNPDDPEGLKKLWKVNPELALKIADYQRERTFANASAEYFGSSNALLGIGRGPRPPAAGQPGLNALAPVYPSTSFDQAFAPFSPKADPANPRMPGPISGYGGGTFDTNGRPVTTGGTGPDNPTRWADTGQPAGADLLHFGQPQTGRDRAFLQMLKADPIKAMKIDSSLRDNFVERMKGEHEFYGMAVQELGRVQDDAGWQAALARLEPAAGALGMDLGEMVPLAYPGPELVKSIMERALPVKERLDYLMRGANMEADNARSDRNTDSMISTREGRLSETRRYNTARIGVTERGQDLTDTRVRRGQDLTEKRGRRAGGGRSGDGSGATSLPLVKSPDEARKLPKGTKFRTPDGRVMVNP